MCTSRRTEAFNESITNIVRYSLANAYNLVHGINSIPTQWALLFGRYTSGHLLNTISFNDRVCCILGYLKGDVYFINFLK